MGTLLLRVHEDHRPGSSCAFQDGRAESPGMNREFGVMGGF
jgi:hypothetical protein